MFLLTTFDSICAGSNPGCKLAEVKKLRMPVACALLVKEAAPLHWPLSASAAGRSEESANGDLGEEGEEGEEGVEGKEGEEGEKGEEGEGGEQGEEAGVGGDGGESVVEETRAMTLAALKTLVARYKDELRELETQTTAFEAARTAATEHFSGRLHESERKPAKAAVRQSAADLAQCKSAIQKKARCISSANVQIEQLRNPAIAQEKAAAATLKRKRAFENRAKERLAANTKRAAEITKNPKLSRKEEGGSLQGSVRGGVRSSVADASQRAASRAAAMAHWRKEVRPLVVVAANPQHSAPLHLVATTVGLAGDGARF